MNARWSWQTAVLVAACLLGGCGAADETAGTDAAPASAAAPAFKRVDTGTSEGIDLLRQSAEGGHAQSMYELGELYYAGRGVPRSAEQAAQWWLKAAQADHRMAQFNIGAMYLKGDGIEKSSREGIRWLTAAAEHGHAEAQSALGRQYLSGANVPKNEAVAVEWLNKAVAGGSRSAMKFLAVMYWHGRGGLPRDPRRTFELFSQAADPADPDSLLNLGYCFRDGRGIQADPYAAFVFLNAALASGQEDVEVRARQALNSLWDTLPAQDVVTGQKLSASLLDGRVTVADLVVRFVPKPAPTY